METISGREDLLFLEEEMRRNRSSFVMMGNSLRIIKEKKLYKHAEGNLYSSFFNYCERVWNIKRSQSSRLIESSRIVELIKSRQLTAPESEYQIRPLTGLDDEFKIRVWSQFLTMFPDGKSSQKQFVDIIESMKTVSILVKNSGKDRPTDARQFATIAISHLERIRNDDPERRKELNRVSDWIKKYYNKFK